MSLYQKVRPTEFKDMKGNFSAIEKALSRPEHNHTFLFIGPAGCGKTTSARIIATKVGADELDIAEINCATETGIDNIRQLLSTMIRSPLGKARIFILDEVHKLSAAAQNALLKATEDTPKYVYFILCSSEPKSIIPALQSRASIFRFPPLTQDDLFDMLLSVKLSEGLAVSKKALLAVAKAAEGSARKALVILEQIASLPEEEQGEAIKYDSGEVNEVVDLGYMLFTTPGKHTWKAFEEVLRSLKTQGIEAETVRRFLLGYGVGFLLKHPEPKFSFMLEQFEKPYYDSGFAGLVNSVYRIWVYFNDPKTTF